MFLSGIFFLWFHNIILAVIISACLSIYISDIFSNFERTRISRLHRQLIGFLEYMTIMLRAGKTVRYVFQHSWTRFPEPLKTYLRDVGQKLEIDPDLEQALDLFEHKCRGREASLISAGIKINNRLGGDLTILLDSISVTLRENLRARSRMDNLTLQSRLSANVISFFPIAALILLYIFYCRSIIDFFSSPVGSVVLVVGGVLEIMGIIFMKKITGNR